MLLDEAVREKARSELAMLRGFSAAIAGGERYKELHEELLEISET
jgi:hypothetical protein